jgi:hypothetical protein
MKRFLLSIFLILAFCFTAFAQNFNFLTTGFYASSFDEIIKFDQYWHLSIKDEKSRLDNLFNSLANDKNTKGLIAFRLNKNDSVKKKLKRFKAISRHLNYRMTDKSRITFAFLKTDEEETIIWLQPQDVDLMPLISSENEKYKIIKAEEFEQKITELFPNK